IAPATLSLGKADNFFDNIWNRLASDDTSYFKLLAYHRYSGTSAGNLQNIEDRVLTHPLIGGFMNEWWHNSNNYVTLHEDIKNGANAAWQQGVACSPFSGSKTPLYRVDTTQTPPRVYLADKTKFNMLYYRYVRAGAIRIGASTTNNDFDPVAFINTDNKCVVVIKADQGGAFIIQGLPAGLYGIKYTTNNDFDVDLPDVMLTTGQSLSASIPETGVITIYQKAPSMGNQSPIVHDIPNQTVLEGENFNIIHLDSFVIDPNHLVNELNWSVHGNRELSVTIDTQRIAFVTIPDTNWFGTEEITFTATDPGGLSDSDSARFTVTPVNDPPIISNTLPDSLSITSNDPDTLDIWEHVEDAETPDSLLIFQFTANPDSVRLNYNPLMGSLIVSSDNPEYDGVVLVNMMVEDDSGATAEDTIIVGVNLGQGQNSSPNNEIPSEYILMQNFPNPFNPITTIRFGLPKASHVRITIFNPLGQRVNKLIDTRKEAGYHEVQFNAHNHASGIFFYKLEAGNFKTIKKMILMK
ncbi:MAG: T9SS type A sorting domain-containing protein, partial [Nitrosopumilaceae archaeon]|nr:T9SS type A sorting domain-containing protein [Nitrosopumilaceae archaeon]NIX62875.1 T9SS type A sorting domain-containing protein [Nitrosopumilaceae archaeon]